MLKSVKSFETILASYYDELIFKKIWYEQVATILPQYDSKTGKVSTFDDTFIANTKTVSKKPKRSNSANKRGRIRGYGNWNGSNRSNRKKMTPDDFRAYNSKKKSTHCGNHCGWGTDHENNDAIKDVLPSIEPNNGPKNNGNISISHIFRNRNQEFQRTNI